MQTPGEKLLIETVQNIIQTKNNDDTKLRLLNIGAGTSVVIENHLSIDTNAFTCDRLDIVDSSVKHKNVGQIITASVESMPMIADNTYDIVFANYVLEHVHNLEQTTKELYRILKPGGTAVLTIPNVAAPEFKISKHTPLWFHNLVRGKPGHEVSYTYKTIPELITFFTKQGFIVETRKQFAYTYGYLHRFPVINLLSKAYDWLITKLHIQTYMGDTCLSFKK